MIPRRETPQAIEERGALKARYTRSVGPVLRGMVLIVALCAFIPFLAGLLGIYGVSWGAAGVVFVLASFTLIAITAKPKSPSGIEEKLAEKSGQHGLPWSLWAYSLIIGLGFNWVCVYLGFSRRYAVFSAPVVGVTCLILTLYAAIGLLVAYLTGGNWRKALLICAISQGVPAAIVLRLGLLR